MPVGTVQFSRPTTSLYGKEPDMIVATPMLSNWSDICTAPETADNAGSTVLNPGGITRSDQNVYNTMGRGSSVELRLKYGATVTGLTNPVVQPFGKDGNGLYSRLADANGDHEITLPLDATNDHTDGTFKYSAPVLVDLAGNRDLFVAIKTAFNGTGTKTDSVLQARVVSRAIDADLTASAPTILNQTMTLADTEYPISLPAGTRSIAFQCRDGTEFRYAFATGKVAGPTEPYMTVRPEAAYNAPLIQIHGSVSTLYVGCASAGKIIEVLAWRKV